MRSMTSRFVTGFASLAMAAASFGFTTSAKADQWERGCSAATVRGAYGVKLGGIVQAPTRPERKIDLVALVNFDGAGKFTAAVTGRINGDPLPATIAGAYQVTSDCRGSLDITQLFKSFAGDIFKSAPAAFVAVDQGDKLLLVVDLAPPAEAPVVVQISGEAERVGVNRRR